MMCLRNLFRRRLRTSLCILGITLAVMSIVAIGATTSRYAAVIKETNIFFSGHVVVVAEGSLVIQAFPIRGGNLPEDTINEVRQVEGVNTAVPMLIVFSYKLEGSIQLMPTNVSVGMPPEKWLILVGSTPLKSGGSWPSTDSGEKEVVVGASLADQHGLNVGSKINIENHDLGVVGILEARSALLSRSIIMPLELAQSIYFGHTMWVNMIVVELEEGEVEEGIADRIETEVMGVEALTSGERNEMVQPFLHDVEMWSLGIRSVIFFLSAILIMVVAMMNVSERRRDFATLDAIGAPKSSIFHMVVTETSLIGLFGGLAGTLLGAFAALLIASFYTNIPVALFFPGLFDMVSPTFIVEILASTVAISCIAGVIPAIAATKMSIIEVLRAEY